MVEYALLAALIAVGAISSVAGIGKGAQDTFIVPGDAIQEAVAAGGITDDEPVM